mgnify:CR=1 FL=1
MSRLIGNTSLHWIKGIEDRTKLKERYDCVVRSLAITLGLSYSAAHAWAKGHGRRDKRGTSWTTVNKLFDDLRDQDRIESVPHKRYYKSTGKLRKMRMSTFAKENPTGKYLVSVSGHMVALVDGTYVETNGKTNSTETVYLKDQYLQSAWKIK